ncbi:transmembrane protein 223-like [Mizuhopecten yessoensis]|uniref:Transmembrane protein 223 n=1 Tax=Mizuhopecten yessoensis TaxID=6573 RepID=A0A210PXH8_MIZYE|nr:transmembrane protein 223-like [Mizuhopecten yessoensis]OWF41200.1 Transmembrane protein 223 [Mizuhopecten yessoensis]
MALLFAKNHNCLLKVCIANRSVFATAAGTLNVRGLAELTKLTNKTVSHLGHSTRVFQKHLLLFPRCLFQTDSSVIRGLKLHRLFSTGNELYRQTPQIKSKGKEFKNLFDLDTNVKKDVLLFSCYKADPIYTFFSWFGLIFLGIAAGIANFSWTLFGALPVETEEEKEKPWSQRLSLRNKIMRYAFVAVMVIVGLLVAGLGFMVPSRTVREIHLVAGGKKGRIVTFGPFGRNIKIERPLKEIVPLHSRTEHKTDLNMKIIGYTGFFTLDTGRGIFHEEKLYDFTVGSKNA